MLSKARHTGDKNVQPPIKEIVTGEYILYTDENIPVSLPHRQQHQQIVPHNRRRSRSQPKSVKMGTRPQYKEEPGVSFQFYGRGGNGRAPAPPAPVPTLMSSSRSISMRSSSSTNDSFIMSSSSISSTRGSTYSDRVSLETNFGSFNPPTALGNNSRLIESGYAPSIQEDDEAHALEQLNGWLHASSVSTQDSFMLSRTDKRARHGTSMETMATMMARGWSHQGTRPQVAKTFTVDNHRSGLLRYPSSGWMASTQTLDASARCAAMPMHDRNTDRQTAMTLPSVVDRYFGVKVGVPSHPPTPRSRRSRGSLSLCLAAPLAMASTSSSAAVAAMVQRASQQYLECRRSVTAKVDEVKLLDEQIAAVFQQISALSEAPEGEEELSEEAKAAAKSVGRLEVTLAGVEGEEPVPNATITVALDPEYEADEYETVEEVVEKKNVVVTDEHGHVVEDGQAPEEDGESTPRKLKTTTKITRTTIKKRVKKEKEPVVRTVAWTAAAQGEEGEEEEKAAALTFPATFVFDPVQSREAVVTITVAAATAEEDGDEDEEPEPVKEIEFPISSLFQGNALDKWYTTTDEEEEEEPTTITELVEEAVKEAVEEEIAAEKAEEAEEAEEAEKTEEAERTEEAAEEADKSEEAAEAELDLLWTDHRGVVIALAPSRDPFAETLQQHNGTSTHFAGPLEDTFSVPLGSPQLLIVLVLRHAHFQSP
ncbi:hypothetical protein ON010_g3770 [Phytophthora cinnamomi]|nr:hypothetical protein ON010_g3770 [Phytophthora cinnamomi]